MGAYNPKLCVPRVNFLEITAGTQIKGGYVVTPKMMVKAGRAFSGMTAVKSGIRVTLKTGVVNGISVKGGIVVTPGSMIIGSVPSGYIISKVPTGVVGGSNIGFGMGFD